MSRRTKVRSEANKLVREAEKLGAVVRRTGREHVLIRHAAITGGECSVSAHRKEPSRVLTLALKRIREHMRAGKQGPLD